MNNYIVLINGNHEFTVEAKNAKEAKKIAVINKRRQGLKGVTEVLLVISKN